LSYPSGKTEKARHTDWMRLENIVALTNAKLLTSPEVSAFGEIRFDASRIKRGDVFVAIDPQDIDTALQNGAYAVIFDKPVQISDTETAWIKVENLEDALLRLLRFRLVEKEITAYACDDIILELARGIDTEGEVVVVHEEITELIKKLWHIESGATLLFSPSQTNADLFVNVKELPSVASEKMEVIEKTLFECSFIFDDHYYERILLSPFFLPFLQRLLNFYKHRGFVYHLRRFDHLTHFEILFTNKNFEPKEFGSSEHVLIFEKDMQLFTEEIGFLTKHAPWARTIYLLPNSHEVEPCENCYYYSDTASLFELLHSTPFHFALIGGVDKEILNESKSFTQPQQLTFDLL